MFHNFPLSISYIKKMEDQPCCPLCHKDLNRMEVGDLSDELSDKIRTLPEDIARSERLLKESRLKYEKLLGLRKHVSLVEKLKSTSIPQVKEDIKKIETELSLGQEKVKKATRDLEEPKEKSNLIAPMIGDVSILEDALRDIQQTKSDLEPLRRKLPSNEGQDDYNLDSLHKKRKEITERYKYLEREITRKEKQCERDAENIRKFKEKEIELRGTELQLRGDIQKMDGLKTREKELIEEIRKLQEKKEISDRSLIPIQAKIRNAEEKRRMKKIQGADKLSKETRYYDGLKKENDHIDRLSKELEKLAHLNLVKEIDKYNTILMELRNEKSNQVN